MAKGQKVVATLLILGAVCLAMVSAVILVARRGEQWINPRARINPKKAYTILLWESPWPAAPGGVVYSLWLGGVLARFRSRFPNIEVKVGWVQPDEMGDRLERALAEGNPPDLVAVGPDALALYDEKRQVPASLYLTETEKKAYFPPSLTMLTRPGDERVWGWPRWVAVHAWLAGPATALERATVSVARPPLSAFLDLMAAAGHPSVYSSEGALLWDRKVASGVLGLLKEKGRAASGEGLGLAGLISGRTGYVVGATPWAVAKAIRASGEGVRPALPKLEAAGLEGKGWVRGSGGAILMFRRPGVPQDHLRAVAETARYLSRSGFPWAGPEGPILPVVSERTIEGEDGVQHQPAAVTYDGFAAQARKMIIIPHLKPYSMVRSEKGYEVTVLAPILEALVEGRITLEEAIKGMAGGKAVGQGS